MQGHKLEIGHQPNSSEFLQLRATIIRVSPEEGRQKIKKLVGQETELNAAQTVFLDKKYREVVILIDSELDPAIQEVLTVHEIAQLRVIRNWLAIGRPIQNILQLAHEIGLSAGIEHSVKLGVKDQYLQLRKKWDDENRRKSQEHTGSK